MTLEWSNAINYGGKGGYEWPNHEGVYVIAKEEDEKLKAIYVGQGNVYENMKRHESKDEQNKCLRDFMQKRNEHTKVYHAQIDSEKKRDDAEYTLWYNYGGTINLLCNENSPPGEFDPTVNFPFDKIDLNYK